jgi:hypothetical protein
MTDPAVQFRNAGFDSPEVQAQITTAFEQLRAAFAPFAEACEQIMRTIVEAAAPIIRAVARWYREMCRLYLIPRAYRMTMMRKKICRYYMQARK